MTLPSFAQNISRSNPVDIGDIDGVVIAAPAAGDILVYDGADWRNRTVTGDITISAAGVTAVVPGTPRQIYQTNAAGLAAEWTSNMDGITIGATAPAPGTFNTLTKTGTTGISWSNVSDEDYEIFTLPGVTGGARWIWDESEDAWSSNFGIEITNGSIDLNAQGSFRQIGNADNQWLSGAITHKGSGTSILERTTAGTTGLRNMLTLQMTSTGDMADTFGAIILFNIEDGGAADQPIGDLGFRRAGADNTGDFVLRTYVAGSANEAFKVDSGGELYADLDGTSGSYLTNGVNLFDAYDDALELQRYAYIQAPSISEGQRQANRMRMLEMGIIEEKQGGSGYFLKFQTFSRLLAGGVYQTRWALDSLREEHETRFCTVDERIEALEGANEILRSQVEALGGKV